MWIRERFSADEKAEYVTDEKMQSELSSPSNGWTYKRISNDRIRATSPLGYSVRDYVRSE